MQGLEVEGTMPGQWEATWHGEAAQRYKHMTLHKETVPEPDCCRHPDTKHLALNSTLYRVYDHAPARADPHHLLRYF